MSKYKTIFMGTPEYVMPSLTALYEETELLAIFTGKDKSGGRGNKALVPKPKNFALEHQIPVYQPGSFKDGKVLSDLQKFEADFIIVNAYGFILPKSILEFPKLAPINLHASLLPKYRGASPIQTAILNGDTETGITAQIMAEKMDEGDIIHQVKTHIEAEDHSESLSYRLSLLSASCLRETLMLFNKNKVERVPQNPNKASYCKKIKKGDGHINWNDPFEKITQKIKAYNPWPQCFTYHGDKKVIVHKIQKVDSHCDSPVGTIKCFNKKAIYVQCGDGTASILELQAENKKKMDYKAFVNGNKWEIKQCLS